MAQYVDGYVIPVPKNKIDDYKKLARKMGKFWIEHGAIEVRECVADDVPFGKVTSFPRAVERKRNETVVFAWVTYKSRAQRDKANKALMSDPRLKAMAEEYSFLDGKRMIFGGFETLVKL